MMLMKLLKHIQRKIKIVLEINRYLKKDQNVKTINK